MIKIIEEYGRIKLDKMRGETRRVHSWSAETEPEPEPGNIRRNHRCNTQNINTNENGNKSEIKRMKMHK